MFSANPINAYENKTPQIIFNRYCNNRKSSMSFSVSTDIPKIEYCTDNAAMIANYANYMFLDNQFSSYDIIPEPRLKF